MVRDRKSVQDLTSELASHGLHISVEDVIRLFIKAATRSRAEFSGTRQRHLSERERALYQAGGFDLDPRGARESDPSAESVAAYAALVFEALTVAKAAKLLDVHPSTIRSRLKRRTLYGFRVDHRWLLPKFQFDGRSTLRGVEVVLTALDAWAHPLSVQGFFATPQRDLIEEFGDEPLSPHEWLRRGRPPEIVAELGACLVLM